MAKVSVIVTLHGGHLVARRHERRGAEAREPADHRDDEDPERVCCVAVTHVFCTILHYLGG